MDAIPASAARPEGCRDRLTSRATAADATCRAIAPVTIAGPAAQADRDLIMTLGITMAVVLAAAKAPREHEHVTMNIAQCRGEARRTGGVAPEEQLACRRRIAGLRSTR